MVAACVLGRSLRSLQGEAYDNMAEVYAKGCLSLHACNHALPLTNEGRNVAR